MSDGSQAADNADAKPGQMTPLSTCNLSQLMNQCEYGNHCALCCLSLTTAFQSYFLATLRVTTSWLSARSLLALLCVSVHRLKILIHFLRALTNTADSSDALPSVSETVLILCCQYIDSIQLWTALS